MSKIQSENGQPGHYNSTQITLVNEQPAGFQFDVNNYLQVTQATAQAGEDVANDVQKVEERFSGSGVLTSDTLVKTGVGFIHTVTFSCNDAAPTAGTIDIYDGTSSSGTKIYTETFDTTAFRGYSILLDQSFSVGLYVDFTTTADVAVSASYR